MSCKWWREGGSYPCDDANGTKDINFNFKCDSWNLYLSRVSLLAFKGEQDEDEIRGNIAAILSFHFILGGCCVGGGV